MHTMCPVMEGHTSACMVLRLCSVFERLEQRMAAETEATEKSALRKLGRRLQDVHKELQEYSDLLSR